ncbi:tyrosine-type recombinase/integrase [Vibrio sp. ZSDE26]|uniref:Tyrosine-type recombinase/integrase n=1 Tax=Vibrio amylolyticus TaxID=2847292 RepID=A0A9X2BJM9_9VIBR|nr:integrase domain-containing protein [Vibrio amylolyticus]MCK6265370.1 tyrosine-type recombinase/integrase [Vibrio amylolyticus]
MARKTTRLTDKELKAAKPKDKDYVLSDGEGLQFRVRKNGTTQWNLNYYHPITKKRINLGLGTYPNLTLANARKLALQAKEQLALGIDPKESREKSNKEQAAIIEHTLFNVASEWFEVKRNDVTENYAKDIWRSLELYVFPALSKTPISKITAPMVIELLRPVEAKGSLETVKRVTQRLNEIMDHSVNCGLAPANPLSGIRAAFKKPKKENMKALAPAELPELMAAIANASIKRTTRSLIEWQLHTMTRPNEAAGAKWNEIDLENNQWLIPAERMKKRKEHSIPLTPQMIAILESMKPISGHREFVFPADRDPKQPTNSQTANAALKRMGFAGRLVSHGLRSIASTTLNEQGFDSDLIEAALAHVDKNEVRRAYNRTDYLERRRPMMKWWSNHIEQASQGSLSVTGYKSLRVVGDE